jgi:hypothetical protein
MQIALSLITPALITPALITLALITPALITPALITTARAESSDSDIAALRQELRGLAERNQKQIDALQREVRDLKAALAKSRAAPPSRAAASAAAGAPAAERPPAAMAAAAPNGASEELPVAPKPMEYTTPTPPPMLPPQMLNLPGRSVTPPYTGAGPGTPGPAPVTPAAAVASGGSRVALSLSGQVDRALLYGNDGVNSKLHNVDNNNSSTRFRIVGEARPLDDTVAGMNLELEVRANSSANTTLTQNLPQPASAVTPTVRQAEIYGGNPNYGEVRLGFGSTASYLTAEVDLSGTAVASYAQVADFDGGFAFRQKGAAMVPGGAGGAFVPSPANAYGPAVASVFNYFNGLGRDDRIRYDSPIWGGVQLSTSLLDGGAFDLAARYAQQFEDVQIAGAAGLGFATARGRPQPIAYGYAGVPAGFLGSSLAGTNAAPNSPTTADVNADKSTQFDGSVSVLLKSGLNLTVAGGIRDPHYTDPTGRPQSPNFIFVKLGYQHHFFPIGLTAFSVDFAENDELIFNGDVARAYGIAAVQNIDQFGLELFVAGRYQTLDRTFASYRPLIAVMSGGRVRF